jgi:hypothetical protein
MNKKEENNENISEGNTSNSDTQDFISSSEEIKSGAHQKFIDNKFLGCNVNENGKREKRTRNRPSKAERYTEEREELIKDLNNLTGINEKNHMILYELNNNEKLKEKIRELVPLIKKYYRTCSWGYFSNDEKKVKGNEIGLLKTIYKNEGYNILTKRKLCEYDGKKKLQTELYFIKE